MALIRQLILLMVLELVLRCIMKRAMRVRFGSLMWLSVWEGIHRISEGIGGRLLMVLLGMLGMLGKGLGRVGRISSSWIEVGAVRDIVGHVMVGHGSRLAESFLILLGGREEGPGGTLRMRGTEGLIVAATEVLIGSSATPMDQHAH